MNVSIPQKGLPPCGKKCMQSSFRELLSFNTAKGSPPMRLEGETGWVDVIWVSIPQKGLPPCGLAFDAGVEYAIKVSIPQKGLPPCGFALYFLIKRNPRKFQYRKRVSPHAAFESNIDRCLVLCFNTAKGSPPMRLNKQILNRHSGNVVSIPQKGLPPCGL